MSYITNEDIEKDLDFDLRKIKWAVGLIGSGDIGSTHIAMQKFKDSMDKETFAREVLGHWEDKMPNPKNIKNFKEICNGNWQDENEVLKLCNELPISFFLNEENGLPYPLQKVKQCEPIKPKLTGGIIEWVKTVFDDPYPYQKPIPIKDFLHGIQVEDKGYLFANEFMDPYNYKETVEQIAQQMPPFEKPKPKKKAKVSDFKKRINSFLRKK